jgi:hypothetical protein
MKKIIITEEQFKNVLDNLITEQEEITRNKVIQCFLSKLYKKPIKIDGFIGNETKQYIQQFQSSKGIYPADGIWGSETSSKMTQQEKALWKLCVKQFGDLFDRWFGI